MSPVLKKIVVPLLLSLCLVVAPGAFAAKGKPRLAVTKLDSPPATVDPEASFDIGGTIRNRGKRTFEGTESTDGLRIELRGPAIERTTVATAPTPRVKARGKNGFSAAVTIPASLGAADANGPFGVFACIRKQGDAGKFHCHKAKGKLTVNGQTPPPGPNFTPGSRSLGDPYFPQIGNGGYDALNYAIELDYDPATNSFATGTRTTMTARATQDLSEFSLDFQDDLVVSAVRVNGQAAGFANVDAEPQFSSDPSVTQPKKLVVTPAAGIASGSVFEVEVAYAGTPVEITDADTSIEGWIRACQVPATQTGCDGSFTVNEPIGVQSWFPSNNVPADKATIDTEITVPTTHVTIGTGELGSRTDNGNGTTTWSWSEDDPASPYLTSATVGLFDYSDTALVNETSTGRSFPIYAAVDSAKSTIAKGNFDTRVLAIPATTNFFSDRYGPYPFDSTGAVADIAPDVGYALENQTKPHYAGSMTNMFSASTQAHEIAHQWMGNSVGPATWREIWFNEGWADFSATLFNNNADETAMQAYFDDNYNSVSNDWSIPPASLPGPESLFEFFPVYRRPGVMLEGYREIVGNEAFFDFAQGLLADHGYGVITTDEFIAEATAASGLAGTDLALLDDYFQQWLRGTVQPTLTPDDFPPPSP